MLGNTSGRTDCCPDTLTSMTEHTLSDDETQEQIIGMHPFRGLGIPDDIARAAVFLASEDASWITGVSILRLSRHG